MVQPELSAARRRGLALALAALACLGAAVAADGPGHALDDLRQAVLARDVRALLACVSSRSQSRHRELYQIARAGGDGAGAALSHDERVLVHALRRLAGAELEQAEQLDEFLAKLLVARPADATELARLGLGGLRASPAGVQALVLRDGLPIGVLVDLVNEDGAWRVDRLHSPLLEPLALRLASAATGLDENAVVDRLLAQIAGG